MSREERICRSCGATIPPHATECPKCGRLAIDRKAARLGATPTAPSPPPDIARKSAEAEKAKEQSGDLPEAVGESAKEPPATKPDSFFGLAPRYEEPPPKEEQIEEGAPRTEAPRCGPCAVVLVIVGWLLTLAAYIH